MRLFMIGSMQHLESGEDKDAFIKASMSIGESLCKNGHKIIICSSHPGTIDRYVIDGANNVGKRCSVILYRPDTKTMAKDTEYGIDEYLKEGNYANIHFEIVETKGGWRNVHLVALRDCDLVVAVGGRDRGTGSLIYSAQAIGKPVVVIPTFKGASSNVWDDIQNYYTPEVRAILENKWIGKQQWGTKIVETAENLRKKNPFSVVSTGSKILKLVISVSAVIIWIYMYWEGLSFLPHWLSLCILLFVSSLAGSSLRSTARSLLTISSEWSRDDLLGEALLGLMISFGLFIIPQGLGFLLYDEPVQIDSLADIRRIGGIFSVLSFSCSLFVEKAWKNLSVKFKGNV